MEDFILIENKKFPVKFGYGAFRRLGMHWNCKGIKETITKLEVLNSIDENITFEQEEMLIDIVLSGIACADNVNDLPSRDDVISAIMHEPKIMEKVTMMMISSLPGTGSDTKEKKTVRQKKK